MRIAGLSKEEGAPLGNPAMVFYGAAGKRMHRLSACGGIALAEALIGCALLVVGTGALLLGMRSSMDHATYLSEFQVAMNAAQGELDALMSKGFGTLATGSELTGARGTTGSCVGIGEDVNCNGILDAGEDRNGDDRVDSPLPGGRLLIQIKQPDGSPPTAESTLLTLHVAACWAFHGRQIGEDRNCDGQLGAGEDANGSGWADSPAMISTRVARSD